jgi:hypothetical protein
MPSSSPKQARTMAAIAHGWKPRIHIPVKVAKEFNQADKARAHQTVKALRRKQP